MVTEGNPAACELEVRRACDNHAQGYLIRPLVKGLSDGEEDNLDHSEPPNRTSPAATEAECPNEVWHEIACFSRLSLNHGNISVATTFLMRDRPGSSLKLAAGVSPGATHPVGNYFELDRRIRTQGG